jgi:hypothetical protein
MRKFLYTSYVRRDGMKKNCIRVENLHINQYPQLEFLHNHNNFSRILIYEELQVHVTPTDPLQTLAYSWFSSISPTHSMLQNYRYKLEIIKHFVMEVTCVRSVLIPYAQWLRVALCVRESDCKFHNFLSAVKGTYPERGGTSDRMKWNLFQTSQKPLCILKSHSTNKSMFFCLFI